MYTNLKRYAPLAILILLTVFLVYLLKHNTAVLFTYVGNDPLFYIPNTDTEALAESVALLDKEESEILQDIRVRIDEETANVDEEELQVLADLTDSGFMPHAYLVRLPDTIEATDRFLSKPSIINAFFMNLSVLRAAQAYQKESASLYGLAKRAHEANPFVVNMISARSRTDQMVSDIDLIGKNGQQLRKEALARFWCLFALRCMIPSIPYTPVSASRPIFEPHEYELLPDEITDLDFAHLERFGPYLIENDCFPQRYTPMYLYTNFTNVFIAKDATNNYYYDVSPSSTANTDSFTYDLLKRGIRFDSQPEGSSYRCINLKYWGDLSTIYYFNAERSMRDITSSYDLDGLREELSGTATPQSAEDLRVLDNRLPHLPLMLGTIHLYLEVLDAQLKEYTSPIEPMYLLGMRSNYALTYQTFSRSVWRLDGHPVYTTERNLPVASNYATYRELRDQFSIEEIQTFHEKRNFSVQ